MEVYSGCYKIKLIEYWNIGTPETSAQIGRRLREKLRLPRSAAGYYDSSLDCHTALRDTSRAAVTTAKLSGRLDGIFSQQWFLLNHKAFHLVIVVFVPVTRFATSWYGMDYFRFSIYVHMVNLAGRVLMVGSLPSSSIISPQWPPSGAYLSSHNGHAQVLLQLCSSTICAPLTTFKLYSWDRTDLVWGAWESGEKIRYYPALRIHAIAWIHQISDKASETKSWER